MADVIGAEQLRLFIERIERLEEEKKGMQDDIRDVYNEAKSTGYDAKTMRAIVRLRKMEKHTRDEAEALLETYKAALGLGGYSAPAPDRMRRVMERTVDAVNAGALGPNVTAEISPARPPVDEALLYGDAVRLVAEHCKASTSWLQRQLRIGYNSAARLVDRMEREGLVSAPNHVGAREVLPEAAVAAVRLEMA